MYEYEAYVGVSEVEQINLQMGKHTGTILFYFSH